MRVGSLFTGYGGLDMAVGGELAWYAEIEKAACQVLAAHYPNVPNLGDITTIDWSTVEPVDVLTGGYPCQPFSHAGKRKGKNDERHLWPYVLDAICAIRPRYAILENVSGHLSLGFDSVLTDLAKIGWAAEWGTFRASDIGAPHRRERLFIIAYADSKGLQGHDSGNGEAPTTGHGHNQQGAGSLVADTSGERHGRGQRPASMERVGVTSKSSRRQTSTTRQESGTGSIDNAADTTTPDTSGSTRTGTESSNLGTLTRQATESGKRFGDSADTDWGKYAPAINRWGTVLDRPAPAPTVERKDKRRLNPQFVEWMMGLPDGHVTGHGLSAAQELKMLGNGVVPQQARAAITQLLERTQQ